MNQSDKDLIRRNYTKLIDSLASHVEDVVEKLFENQIISKRMQENIIEGNTINRKKARALLDLLPTRGPKAFEAFYQATKTLQIFDVADILRPGNKSHFAEERNTSDPTDESADEELPSRWPSDETKNEYSKLKRVEDEHKRMRKLFERSLTPNDQMYTMSARCRGRLILINNEQFHTFKKREGSLIDRMALETLFQDLGFVPLVHKDKTATEIKDLLTQEANDVFHQKANCFVLVILSHGHTGVVFGTDGYMKNQIPFNCVSLEEITDLFINCRHLVGKPKLFFIQACQGDKKNGQPLGRDVSDNPILDDNECEDQNINLAGSEASEEDVFALNVIPRDPTEVINAEHASLSSREDNQANSGNLDVRNINEERALSLGADVRQPAPAVDNQVSRQSAPAVDNQVSRQCAPAVDNQVSSHEETDAAGQRIPIGADVFVAVATIPGFLSWRNTTHGTWFIQAIAFIFAKYAYKHDLNTLMTMVNNLVSRGEAQEEGFKQVAEKRDTFQKKFYFFPGLYKP